MLRLILQHWQSNRRKISIFPEPFEPDQPITRINPIYQDTESSSTPSPKVRRAESSGPVLTNVVAEIHKEPTTTMMARNKNAVAANKSALHSNPETHAVLAKALSTTIANNNNLKPSEVVKRQKELLQNNGSLPTTEELVVGTQTSTKDVAPVLTIPPPPPLSTIQEVDDSDTQQQPPLVGGVTRSENSRLSEMKLKEAAKETLKKRTEEADKQKKEEEEEVEATTSATKAATTTNPSIKVPSEDSGITRGDQAPSDEGNNSTGTNQSSAESNNNNKKDNIRDKFGGKGGFCKKCANRRSARQSVAVGKYDEYYLAAILGSKEHRYNRHSNDSLSDFSSDRFRNGAIKVCKSCQRERRRKYRRGPPDGSVSEEDFLERRPSMRNKYRRASWASCSCDQCSEASFSFERRPKSLHDISDDCTCGQEHRRVKFANRNGETPPLKSSISKTSLNTETNKTDASEADASANRETVNNSMEEKKNGSLKKPGFNQYPWELEDWQGYLRKRQLKQRRRRAFYMIFLALVIIIIIGMAVGLVLTWLRSKR